MATLQQSINTPTMGVCACHAQTAIHGRSLRSVAPSCTTSNCSALRRSTTKSGTLLDGPASGLRQRTDGSTSGRHQPTVSRPSAGVMEAPTAPDTAQGCKLSLISLGGAEREDAPLLVYFPGADGTGMAISPQLPGLVDLGFDVRALHIPLEDRSGWQQLTDAAIDLLSAALASKPSFGGRRRALLVAESFGGCLALRVAAQAGEGMLLDRLVLINPATSFPRSYAGLPGLIASTNLLSVFPEPLYQVAQAVLVPLLVDREQVSPLDTAALMSMMGMQPSASAGGGDGAQQLQQWQQGGAFSVSVVPSNDGCGSDGVAGGGGGGGVVPLWQRTQALLSPHLPAASASWRLQLLRGGDLPDKVLATIRVPALVIASAQDRMLPSVSEASRLQNVMPSATRLVLPGSSHTALLEQSVSLASILTERGFLHPALADSSESSECGGARHSGDGGSGGGASGPGVAEVPREVGTVEEEGAGEEADEGDEAGQRGGDDAEAEQAAPMPLVVVASEEKGEQQEEEEAAGAPAEAAQEGASSSTGEGTSSGGSDDSAAEEGKEGASTSEASSSGGDDSTAEEGKEAAVEGTSSSGDASSSSGDELAKASPKPPKKQPPLKSLVGAARETMVQRLLTAIETDISSAEGGGESGEEEGRRAVQEDAAPEKQVVMCSIDQQPEDVVTKRDVSVANMRSWAQKATLSFLAITNKRKPTSSDTLAPAVDADPSPPPSPSASSAAGKDDDGHDDISGGNNGSGGQPAPRPSPKPEGGGGEQQQGEEEGSPAVALSLQAGSTNGAAPAPLGSVHSKARVGSDARAEADAAAALAAAAARRQLDDAYERAVQVLGPWRAVVSPVVLGEENLAPWLATGTRPVLFVGNHTMFGLYDLPLLMMELYLRGFRARGLAHPMHWRTPMGGFFETFGAVKVSPRAMYKLLKANEQVLLFPGGGREVLKRRGESYQLFWQEQVDFVRMAARCGAVIVPFAAVGGDDAYDLMMDSQDILSNPVLGPLARQLVAAIQPGSGMAVEELVPPVVRLPGPLGALPALMPVPNLERLYFKFMPPIDTAEQLRDVKDAAQCERLYRQVQGEVEEGIQQLLVEQRTDPLRAPGPRLAHAARQALPAFDLLGWA